MGRSRRGASVAPAASDVDAQLRSIPNEDLLDFLAAARRRLATAAPLEAGAYAAAVASLELEATRRGLALATPHERMPPRLVVARLQVLRPSEHGGEWERLLAELDLPGLWFVYLMALQGLPSEEQVAGFAAICVAVDRIVYGGNAAHMRRLKHVDLPLTDEARLAKLHGALEQTFGMIFDRLSEGEANP